jgi:hypothetical protein
MDASIPHQVKSSSKYETVLYFYDKEVNCQFLGANGTYFDDSIPDGTHMLRGRGYRSGSKDTRLQL